MNLTREFIRDVVRRIPDPEIPVLTIGDLGIVRDVKLEGNKTMVIISPTYTGCPATKLIGDLILKRLKDLALEKTQIVHSISPPWSSDWISEDGRRKLCEYGIAPPNPSKNARPQHCPRCSAEKIEKISEFGATPCQALWRCQSCLETFNYFKCI